MSNYTVPVEVHVDFYYIFSIITLCLFIIVAFFGNLFVIIVFLTTKELQTQVNYFLASLALADLLTAMFPLPIWLAFKIHNYWAFSITLLKIWKCADLTLCTASIWNLCAISIDRCLAISCPFLHRSALTSFRMKWAVALVWGYSCTIAVLITDSVAWKQRGLLISCLSYYLPTVLIIAAYLTIYVSQLKSRFEFSRRENIDISSTIRSKQDLRMAKYMILLIVSFLVCWAGHYVMGTLHAFTQPRVDPVVQDCIKAMSYANACVNPFLYGYVSPKFRVAFKTIFRGRRNSRRALVEISPARGNPSRKTSMTKLEDRATNGSGSQDSAV